MTPQVEIQLICATVAAACALVGGFLVLRRASMLSDAISHAILPGIVVAFFLTESLSSPLLLVAAAATGVLTVALIEALGRTRLVKQDAAIGLVFPALFSVGVLLIARFADDVHLDTDAVLLGDPAFSWIERFTVGGVDLGPMALWLMALVLALNLAFVGVFYK
ncbi:MAG: metal ABC transporter permease, partial [Bacteroidota bacterium]